MEQVILGLMAQTSIHAGAGSAVGVIDLPIMRESHTGWPCVFGSAVKGAMRSKATLAKAPWVNDVFGPDTRNASDHAGAISVGDARLLLLPVRSLTTHFKWVTCPAALARSAQDARRMGYANAPATGVDMPAQDEVLVCSDDKSLFLEDLHFKAKKVDLQAWVDWLASFTGASQKEALVRQLVVVHDDIFSHLAQFSTAVTPHIAIEDKERKIVKNGALWYEETLPAQSLLYVSVAAQKCRRRDSDMGAGEVLNAVLGMFPADKPYLQVGGNETVGMGWCQVQKVEG